MQTLQTLIVEDNPVDAELVVQELHRAGFHPQWTRVETETDFLAALEKPPDIILSDYSMPAFSGLRAVKLLRRSGLDIPLILVSGTVGEDVAVEAMKHGATDYLLKDRVVRLGSAVKRALEERRLRDERKQAEAALRLSEAQLRATFEGAAIGIALMNLEGRLLKCNPALTRMLGHSEMELHRLTLPEIIHPEDVVTVRQLHHSLLAGERGQCEIEKRFLRQDGQTVWGRLTLSLVKQADAESPLAIGMVEDITGKRQLEEQFRQAQKMEAIGQLASGVAHDFNNILAVIQMQVALLSAGGDLSPAQADSAAGIGKASEHAANLTRQLLLFGRRQVMQPRDLNLNDTISQISKMFQRILGEDIRINFKYAAHPVFVHADASMIDQVLMNLAVNSRDAMPKGGELTFEISDVEFDVSSAAQAPPARPGSFACLSVTDTGCGIAPEILPKIFEPFFTTKDVGKGTGLGLATVFGIVQQHQGWINVQSEAGRGTTFRIYFPRLTRPAEEKSHPPTPSAARGGDETILLVEDDAPLRLLVEAALTRLGYRVLSANTGVQALKVWQSYRGDIDLLLTDLIMPDGMNGRELAEQLLRDNPRLKLVYTSGYSADIFGNNFPIQEGVNFLNKPFVLSELAQTIRRCLDNRHS